MSFNWIKATPLERAKQFRSHCDKHMKGSSTPIHNCCFCKKPIVEGNRYYIGVYPDMANHNRSKTGWLAHTWCADEYKEEPNMSKPYGSMNGHEKNKLAESGSTLASLRKRLNRSLESLAFCMGISAEQLRQVEAGNRRLTEKEALKMADAFGMSNREFNKVYGFTVLVEATKVEIKEEKKLPQTITSTPETSRSVNNRHVQGRTPLDIPVREDASKLTKVEVMPNQEIKPSLNLSPDMPDLNLGQFYTVYEKMRQEQQSLGNLLVQLDLYDPEKTINQNIAEALKMLVENVQFLNKAIKDTKAQGQGLQTLKALREILDEDIKKLEST